MLNTWAHTSVARREKKCTFSFGVSLSRTHVHMVVERPERFCIGWRSPKPFSCFACAACWLPLIRRSASELVWCAADGRTHTGAGNCARGSGGSTDGTCSVSAARPTALRCVRLRMLVQMFCSPRIVDSSFSLIRRCSAFHRTAQRSAYPWE